MRSSKILVVLAVAFLIVALPNVARGAGQGNPSGGSPPR